MDTRIDNLAVGRARAIDGHRQRAELLTQFREGRVTFDEILERDDNATRQIPIGSLLRSLPGVGRLKTAVLLAAAEVEDSRRLVGLSPQDRRRIAAALAVLATPQAVA